MLSDWPWTGLSNKVSWPMTDFRLVWKALKEKTKTALLLQFEVEYGILPNQEIDIEFLPKLCRHNEKNQVDIIVWNGQEGGVRLNPRPQLDCMGDRHDFSWEIPLYFSTRFHCASSTFSKGRRYAVARH